MLRNRKPWRKAAIALLALTVFAVGCGKGKGKDEAEKENLVATYKDGGQVTRAELDKYVGVNLLFQPMYEMYKDDPEFQNMMLKQFVGLKSMAAKADGAVKEDVKGKLKTQMEEFDKALGENPNAKQSMDEKGIKKEDIEEFFGRHMTANGVAANDVKEEDIKKEFDDAIAQDADMFNTASVRHVLIMFQAADGTERKKEDALARAKEVQKKLQDGGDFAALAKEYSEDPGSKDKGGLYEDVQVSQWVKSFKAAAMELPLNTISEPVETEYGYHVMKVEKRTVKTYNDVKGNLRSTLADHKLSEYIEAEVPGLIETNNLPSPTPTPSASPSPAASPEASPSPATSAASANP